MKPYEFRRQGLGLEGGIPGSRRSIESSIWPTAGIQESPFDRACGRRKKLPHSQNVFIILVKRERIYTNKAKHF